MNNGRVGGELEASWRCKRPRDRDWARKERCSSRRTSSVGKSITVDTVETPRTAVHAKT